jgi:hypothetical protein
MSSDRRVAVLQLKLIAAQAEKLAYDIENGKLWERDYEIATGALIRAMRDLPNRLR